MSKTARLFDDIMSRRTPQQMLADMISVAHLSAPVTRIYRRANVNPARHRFFLDDLLGRGFLEAMPKNHSGYQSSKRIKALYRSTEKGRRWCDKVWEVHLEGTQEE